MFHKNKMGSIIRSTGTIFYSLSYSNSRTHFYRLKYMYSVISVIVDSLPGNTKNWESTARVRLVHSWAERFKPRRFENVRFFLFWPDSAAKLVLRWRVRIRPPQVIIWGLLTRGHPGNVTIPQYRINKTKQHTHWSNIFIHTHRHIHMYGLCSVLYL